MNRRRVRAPAALLVATVLASGVAAAQPKEPGYALNRYEPTPAGEHFLAVEHPWYSSTRYFAAGLTLDYAYNLLLQGQLDAMGKLVRGQPLVEHQFAGHVDLAGSLFDRIALHLSLPVVLFESGNRVGNLGPMTGVVVGDPRLGLRARLVGQHEDGPIGLSLGLQIWIPLGDYSSTNGNHTGESHVRLKPNLVAGGVIAGRLRWTFNAGFLYRKSTGLRRFDPDFNTLGSEVQLGLGAQLTLLKRSLSFGPELAVSFAVPVDGAIPGPQQFASIELLGSVHYLIAEQVVLHAGGGAGLLGSPGPPDARGLLRIAYAPRRAKPVKPVVLPPDRDHDGILDGVDACPDEKGVATSDAKTNGCPPPKDRDQDEVIDEQDVCPDVAKGKVPDPDPKRLGCPAKDSDGDGVFDFEDKCPEAVIGDKADPTTRGCPAMDADGDGVYDFEDKCPNDKPGLAPDTGQIGCPAADRDGDKVPDDVDACPDKAGAPDADPKRNGCPGLVEVKETGIVILEEVYFDTAKDRIQSRSFKVLNSVSFVLQSNRNIKRVSVEGHTDDRGKAEKNLALSQRRASSVMKYLIERGGIEPERLEAHGYGQERPMASNATAAGRQLNRRVVFMITDPVAKPAAPAPGR